MTDQEKWDEVMKLANEYGLIVFAYGGVAVLMCEEEREKVGCSKEDEK